MPFRLDRRPEVKSREVAENEFCTDAEMLVEGNDGRKYCVLKESIEDE